MKSLCVQIVAFLAMRLIADSSLSAQELPPAYPDPKDIPALNATKFTTLLVKNETNDYSVTLDINGTRYAAFNSGTKWRVDAAPFREGSNHVGIVFTPTPSKNLKEQSGKITLVLADDPRPKPNHALILYQAVAVDNAFCVTDLTFQFVSGHATRLQLKEDHWLDAAHKKHIYEMSSNDGTVWGPLDQHERSWSPTGQPVDESVYKMSTQTGSLVLSESKDYKPDGSLAAEVKNGTGVRRVYSDAGFLSKEMFYRGGMMNGPYKEFDDHGKVSIAGNFKDDQQDGTWIRYGPQGKEIARAIYIQGELRSGDRIDTGPTTAPSNQ